MRLGLGILKMYRTFYFLLQTRLCWNRSGHPCSFGPTTHIPLLLPLAHFGLWCVLLGARVRLSEVSALEI